MMLSDLSIRRPVLAAVISLLLIAFGSVAFDLLPLREYPDIDPPIVTVETTYEARNEAEEFQSGELFHRGKGGRG